MGFQFRCKQEVLIHALSRVVRAIPTKSSLEVLRGIRIEYKQGILSLRATDMEIHILTNIEQIEGEGQGSAIVPNNLFYDLVKKLSGDIQFVYDDKQASIFCRSGSFHIPVFSNTEFPELPSMNDISGYDIDLSVLTEGIRKTIFPTSPNDHRPFVAGILFLMSNGQLTMAGTDNNRMCIFSIPFPDIPGDIKVILSASHLRELLNCPGEEAQIYLGTRQSLFNVSGVSIYGRLLEGQYPDHTRLLPSIEPPLSITVNRNQFLEVLSRISIFSIMIAMDISRDKLKIKSIAEKGSAKEEVEILDGSGDDRFVIGFNAKHIVEFLNVMDTDKISIDLFGERKQALFYAKDLPGYKYILMPMILKERV